MYSTIRTMTIKLCSICHLFHNVFTMCVFMYIIIIIRWGRGHWVQSLPILGVGVNYWFVTFNINTRRYIYLMELVLFKIKQWCTCISIFKTVECWIYRDMHYQNRKYYASIVHSSMWNVNFVVKYLLPKVVRSHSYIIV